MNRSAVRVLVSDLGQVLLPFDFTGRDERLRALCRGCHCDPVETLLRLHNQMGLTEGRSRAEEFFRRFLHETNLDLTFEEFECIYCDSFWEDRRTVSLIAATNCPVRVLLTNTDEIHWGWIRKRYPHVVGLFHHTVASCDVGVSKPDEAIFRHVEQLTARPPEEHLFIDDVPTYVEAARACGWYAIPYVGAGPLEEALASLGLLS